MKDQIRTAVKEHQLKWFFQMKDIVKNAVKEHQLKWFFQMKDTVKNAVKKCLQISILLKTRAEIPGRVPV